MSECNLDTVSGLIGITPERDIEIRDISHEIILETTHLGAAIEAVEAREDLTDTEKIMICMMYGGFRIYMEK
jgi:hypothetical protein